MGLWLKTIVVLAVLAAPSLEPGAQTPALTLDQVRLILSTTRNLAGRNLSGLNLSGLSLSGADLRNADLSGANLRSVDAQRARLNGAILAQAVLAEADFRRADLSDTVLTRADLTRAKLQGSIFRNARLDEAVLQEADLTDATLNRASLIRANLEKAILTDASLLNANLREARLVHAQLTNAGLTSASLANADLSHATLRGSRLREADLDGADLQGALLVDADLSAARNVDKIRNIDKIRLTAASPLPPMPGRAGAPVAVRIVPRNGSRIDAESWSEQGEVFVYTRGGSTYGIPTENVRRVEDMSGKILREFQERVASRGDPANRPKDCTRPRVGDSSSYMDQYVACVRKYGLTATTSQGTSTKATVEQSGRAVTDTSVKRWEIREGGNVVETYEAIGDRITLASN